MFRKLITMFFLIGLLTYDSSAEINPIKIGLLVELTGPMATNGQDCRDGFELARKYYAPNDQAGVYRINFIYADSQRDPKVGVTEFKRLVEQENVSSVIVLSSPIGMSVNPLSKAGKIPLIGITGHADFVKGNPYAIRVWPSTTADGQALADKVYQDGARRVAIITYEDEWAVSLTSEFKKAYQAKSGTQIVFDENIISLGTDTASLVTLLKRTSPDAVFVNTTIPIMGEVFKKLHELRVSTKKYSNLWAQKQQVVDVAGKEAMRGVVAITPKYDVPEFIAGLKSINRQSNANAISYTCYLALAETVNAIAQIQEPATATREKIITNLSAKNQIQLKGEKLEIGNREANITLGYRVFKDSEFVWE